MRLLVLILIFGTVACGRSNYSVKINLPSESYFDAKEAFAQLNYEAKDDVVKYDEKNPGIIINRTADSNVKYPILAYAVVGGAVCQIYFPDRTLKEDYELIVTVLWHEFGHCLNLMHSDNPKDIMYSSVREITTYNNKYKERFFRRLYEATH